MLRWIYGSRDFLVPSFVPFLCGRNSSGLVNHLALCFCSILEVDLSSLPSLLVCPVSQSSPSLEAFTCCDSEPKIMNMLQLSRLFLFITILSLFTHYTSAAPTSFAEVEDSWHRGLSEVISIPVLAPLLSPPPLIHVHCLSTYTFLWLRSSFYIPLYLYTCLHLAFL